MNVALQRSWTQQEFFIWAEAQDERYEFDGFQPVAMTGGNANHSALHANILLALGNRLGDGPCRVLGSDAGVATVGNSVRYPDALVTCSHFRGEARTIPGVTVVFEVLSPTSGRLDRVVKLQEYAAVPSIRRYVIVESTGVGLTVFSRENGSQSWTATALMNTDVLAMPEIGVEIPVSDLYRRIEFAPDPTE